ncbi:FAD-dependent oxidoreductase [Brucella anthropi]|uniref:NAD(P)/FAD-dependent oxidoreductase n=1 Tax=Brucella anthropi TaxID=529 RepID=UPI000452BACC|nr:FAD-binding oxidoreductase [Brucella anthropi]EXL06515.1 FAD-dependent oxidoreductase [Brucella anthropi]
MSDSSGFQTSLWAATAPDAPQTERFIGEVQTDVLIIGGGFTGCSTALHLAKKNVDVIVLEGAEVGFGGSGRNIGLVNAGLWLNPSVVVERLPKPFGDRIIAGLGQAPAIVRQIASDYGIQCDIGSKGVMKAAHSRAAMKDIEKLVAEWHRLGEPVEVLSKSDMASALGTSRVEGGLIDHRTFTIQPLAYARGLAAAALKEGARIYTSSRVVSLQQHESRWIARTAEGHVVADKVLVSTGAYSSELIPDMVDSFVPAGCFALATKELPDEMRAGVLPGQSAFFDSRPAMHFARYDRTNRLIVGTLGWLPASGDAVSWGKKVLKGYFPQLGNVAFDFAWTGNIDFTDNHLPWLSRPAPGLYAIGGFNGRGIGPGTYWGQILADWLTTLPDAELPLPVGPIKRVRFKKAKQAFYSTAFWAARTKERLL